MPQRLLTAPAPVLDAQGRVQEGYATTAMSNELHTALRGVHPRKKEWDTYYIYDEELCLQLTLLRTSTHCSVHAVLLHCKTGAVLGEVRHKALRGATQFALPENAEAEHDFTYKRGNIHLLIQATPATRSILLQTPNFGCDVILLRKTPQSIVVQTPFSAPSRAFLHRHVINCTVATGKVFVQNTLHAFSENALAVMTFARGILPSRGEHYWANGCAVLDDEAIFGFNLGSGFGNSTLATENILLYRDTAHKLGQVQFDLDTAYLKPWHLYDDADRVDLRFIPACEYATQRTKVLSEHACHLVFGAFSGYVVLDDGTQLRLSALPALVQHATYAV